MKYKVGDKVRVREDLNANDKYFMDNKEIWNDATEDMISLAGEIVEIERADLEYRVKGSRWSWTDEMFEPVNNKKIVITSDGVKTLARLYDGNKVIKTATAKCSPENTFDFKEGARTALHRILGDYAEVKAEKPKYYNGKVVCVEKSKDYMAYTVGKVYEFKDGRVKIDNGNIIPEAGLKAVSSVDEWNNDPNTYAKFIPLVE